MSDASEASWITLDGVRIHAPDRELSGSITFQTQQARVGLVGNWRPLFALLERSAFVATGRGAIAQSPIEHCVRDGHVGLAIADAPLPPSLTAQEYLFHSARLMDLKRAIATRAATQTLVSLGLTPMTQRRLNTLSVYERRALLIAHATLGNPQVLCLETPLGRLDPGSQTFLRGVIDRASVGRRLLVSVLDPNDLGERALLDSLDEVVTLSADGSVTQTASRAPATSGRYTAIVGGNADALIAELETRSASAQVTGDAGALLPMLRTQTQTTARRLTIDLPINTDSGLIIESAVAAGCTLLELIPS